MAKHNGDAVWMNVDADTLAPADKARYDAYKALYRQMKAAREAFEQGMQHIAPQGQRMIFGYNFGKLSVAMVADDRKPEKPKASGPVSLAAWIEQQKRMGVAH